MRDFAMPTQFCCLTYCTKLQLLSLQQLNVSQIHACARVGIVLDQTWKNALTVFHGVETFHIPYIARQAMYNLYRKDVQQKADRMRRRHSIDKSWEPMLEKLGLMGKPRQAPWTVEESSLLFPTFLTWQGTAMLLIFLFGSRFEVICLRQIWVQTVRYGLQQTGAICSVSHK